MGGLKQTPFYKLLYMARIILGNFITDIAGSVGGTTFRRIKNGHQMYNRPIGAARSKLLNNPALLQLANISQGWQALLPADRAKWVAAALLFQFPDKFGTLRNITGYQLYIKNTNFNTAVNGAALDPATFSSTVLNTGITGASLDVNDFAQLILDALLLNTYALIQMEKVATLESIPKFGDNKIIFFQNLTANKTLTFSSEFIAQFPGQIEDEFYAIIVTFQNFSGFRSSPISINIQVGS